MGRKEEAIYRDPLVQAYAGNPLIEALPNIYSESELKKRALVLPPFDPGERELPAHLRIHCLQEGLKLFVPLARFFQLEQHISLCLRGGYAQRRLQDDTFWPTSLKKLHNYPTGSGKPEVFFPTAHHGYLVGVSGTGKTVNTQQILGNLYPQTIYHGEYKGKKLGCTQLVWLKLDCVHDGSVRGLCVEFIRALDEILRTDHAGDYLKGKPHVDDLIPIIARLASLYSLGLLVIDEIQHLRAAFSGGRERMLNFFVHLANRIGVPILLIGTFAALPIFNGEFRQMRRVDGHGPFAWLPMKKSESTWNYFSKKFWDYQYLERKVDWDPEIAEVLRGVSAGIPDYIIKIFMGAQVRGMTNGIKSLNKNLITSVAKDSLQLSRKVLDAMEHGDWDEVEYPEDLPPIDWNEVVKRQSTPEQAELDSSEASEPADDKLNTSKADVAPATCANGAPEKPAQNNQGVSAAAKSGTIMGIIAKAKKRTRNTTSHQALKDAGVARDLLSVVE
jgi:hypothetical protein